MLLFLTALLSALTGAISGVRAPEPQFHNSIAAFAGARPDSVSRIPVARPVRVYLALAQPPRRASVAAEPIGAAIVMVAASSPIYLSKPRR